MWQRRNIGFLFLSLIVIMLNSSCESNGKGTAKTAMRDIYLDYRVWGDEESGLVTIRLQFKIGGPEGQPISIQPAEVMLDGQPLRRDSSKMNGIYYEQHRRVEGFEGTHTISLVTADKKEHRTNFDFPVIYLKTDFAAVIGRQQLVLQLGGLGGNDRMKLLLTDTTFYGRGIDRTDTLKDDRMVITSAELTDLKNGPVQLELIREEEKWIEDGPGLGGLLLLSYRVTREFQLKD